MDPTRPLLIALCSSLARLHMRLISLSYSQRIIPGGRIYSATEAFWKVGELARPSEWFEAAPDSNVSGAVAAIAISQAHLLAMLEVDEPINPRDVIMVIHNVCGGSWWCELERKVAARLGYELAESPQVEFRGVSISVWALSAGPRHRAIELMEQETPERSQAGGA